MLKVRSYSEGDLKVAANHQVGNINNNANNNYNIIETIAKESLNNTQVIPAETRSVQDKK